jgi:glyoxylase-like metal-dependent hydrolase (beta-lactamase superfamily II)/8-oxo-dGTP pyrophosphatase MutT (NUDIX family)
MQARWAVYPAPRRAMTAPATPRLASTLIVIRDADAGLEVLLVRRPERSGDRSSGAYVFPGGTLDPQDRGLHACTSGLDDATASRRLGLEAGGLDYYTAAIRECFEEAGLLYACAADGRLTTLEGIAADELHALRTALRHGDTGLQAVCDRLGLRLAADRLAYHSHWLTPNGLPKRFDTRFFVAEVPPAQTPSADTLETLELRWVRPADALNDPGLKLPNPTRHTLAGMVRFASARDCMEHTRALQHIERIFPRIGVDANGPRPVMPHEPSFAELGRIDPGGTQGARCDLRPGHAVRLSERIVRITAPNGSVMTGPGTNTYFIGDPAGDGWAVIDPGPAMPEHVAAVLAAAPGPVKWILVTHTHKDHSPAAAAVAAQTGAPLLGRRANHPERQDAGFAPDRTLAHGERLSLGPSTTLRVVHTPGHASNHLCYLLEEEATLFTGDHVMQGSTVVIDPPDGDMAAYLRSLEMLLQEDLQWLAPGHGFLIERPHDEVRRLMRHRLAREAKVVAALARSGPATTEDLLPHVYDDVQPRLHPVAMRSLLAHLGKLEGEGRAVLSDGCWRAAG